MHKFLIVFLTLLAQSVFALDTPPLYMPQEGDLLFQSLPRGDLVDAIEGASGSPYSHVGIVVRKNGTWFVREALGKVQDTPFQQWKWRGRNNQAFDAFRLKPAWQRHVPLMLQKSEAFLGRPYDYKYDLDDAAIYCSELAYKAMFNAAGLRLGKLQKLGELRWQPYRKTIEKYEGGQPPLERRMITPRALSEAAELELVYRGYSR
jgi:hypothetical protein